MTTKQDDFLLSRQEAAERLNISVQTLTRLQERGELKRVQVSDRRVGYRNSDVAKFLAARARA